MDLLTLNEAAQLTQTTPDALRMAIRAGRLQARKRGHQWFVERAEIERYIAQRQYWRKAPTTA